MPRTISSADVYIKNHAANLINLDAGSQDIPDEWDYDYEVDDEEGGEEGEIPVSELIEFTPSEFTEAAFRMPDKINNTYVNFSFEGREYLRMIYDIGSKRTLLKCGRQVEKCQTLSTFFSLANGSLKRAGEAQVGDEVITLNTDTQRLETSRITWISPIRRKSCRKIVTRQGHHLEVAHTHPLRAWNSWTESSNLSEGGKVAVVREGGIFVDKAQPAGRIELTGYLIGDGGLSTGAIRFTSLPGRKLDEFVRLAKSLGCGVRFNKSKSSAEDVALSRADVLKGWLKEDGLLGTKSGTKFIPSWVFDLSREDTALFLNRLWSTDGHVKQNTPSKYSIEYCSISEQLIKEVQALLWKFGVPSRIRKNWPNYWKKKGIEKFAYILRVETQKGLRTFLEEIGAFGKSEDVSLPEKDSNNNRDTYPIEINDLIKRIIASRGDVGRRGRRAENSLSGSGLRETLKYAPSEKKIEQYVSFFRKDGRYSQELVDELTSHIGTEVYWDEITSIEDIGEQDCIDFEVEDTHNFVADGFITHNSTLLGNKLLSYCCLIRSLAALYVSPTSTQTKVFSRDRISEPIETSINLGPWLSTKLADNLLLKKLTNRSQITLRYAFQNADRVRGIPADIISLDEIQDILTDNIPVIEECASHSPFKIFMYSGTPKSLDNTLEHYWVNQSTQNEWVVPCYRHSTTTGAGDSNRSGAHWNVLDESNIFKHGLSCDKCEELINPVAEGSQWVALNPQIRDELEEPYEGFRIPQLMVPWITWSEILQKQKVYGRPEFYNEVLGLSYDSGTRPLTRQDVIDNCDPNLLLTDAAIEEMHVRTGRGQSSTIFAGIDWGTGENTFTVISLGTYIDGKFTIFYLKRFEGPESDPKFQLEFISHLIEKWNVNLVGADYGGGFDRNDALTRTFGYLRIAKYQYSAPSTKVKWDDGMRRWMVHRTECMSDVFNAIRRRDVFRFPNWDSFQNPFGDDFLSIFSEYNEQRRMNQYHKSPNATDDAFHSVLLCFLASMIRYPRPDVLAPNAETNSSGLNI